MDFALNYSPQAADLLRTGAITLDRFKCPDWPDLIAEARASCPVYVHFDLRAGPGANGSVDWNAIAALRAQTESPYINLHLGPSQRHFPDMPVDTTDPADRVRITDCLIADVAQAVDRFGAENVIVENVPYHGDGVVMRPAIESDVIRRVVDDTGCGFLLDISHARIAAHTIGRDAHAYLSALPGDRLRELHVTGIGRDERGRLRDHLGLTDADWPFVDWVLARIRAGDWAHPWAMAFEYGGIGPLFEWRSEPAVIAAQVPRLFEMAHAT